MSLADHYDPDKKTGGGYLPEGEIPVSIKGMRFFKFNTGSPGVELEVTNGPNNGSISFNLLPQVLWKLANFSAACGLTKQQMASIDPERQAGFQVFVGKKFVAVVAKKDNGYREVIDFLPDGTPPVVPPKRSAPRPQTETVPADGDPIPF